MNRPNPRGVIWALFAAVMAAGFLIPWKLATIYGSAPAVVLVMLSSAALFNTIILPFIKRNKNLPGCSGLEYGFSAIFAALTLLGNQASAWAISLLSPSVFSVLLRGEVIFVALLASIFLKERAGLLFWLGIALVCVGILVMSPLRQIPQKWLHGMGFSLIATISFATIGVLTRHFINQIEPIRTNALRLWFSVLLWFFVNEWPKTLSVFNPRLILYSSLAAFLGPGVSRLCLMFSARYIEARMTALIVLLTPVITLILGRLFLNDMPKANELWGGMILILGIGFPLLGPDIKLVISNLFSKWFRSPNY